MLYVNESNGSFASVVIESRAHIDWYFKIAHAPRPLVLIMKRIAFCRVWSPDSRASLTRPVSKDCLHKGTCKQ